jgi:chloramphenicol 3-O-phosphotransferase
MMAFAFFAVISGYGDPMKLIFLYGTVAAGKLTVARHLSSLTGFALFHNHLIVDAVGAVFPFGSQSFVRLRERFWLDVFSEAAAARRSLIFTFAPENTVTPDFPDRVQSVIRAAGGEVCFVRLIVSDEEQERRVSDPSRSRHGKLTSAAMLRQLRPVFHSAEARMPEPAITVDTGTVRPEEAALTIANLVLERPASLSCSP